MPSINWLLENKVIYVVTEGDLALEDVQYVSESVINLIDQSDSPLIHIVLSEEKLDSLPKSLSAFNKVVEFLRHERMGWFLIYGNTNRAPIVKFLGTMVIEMAKVRHRRFDTMQECLEFLVEVDPELSSVKDILSESQ